MINDPINRPDDYHYRPLDDEEIFFLTYRWLKRIFNIQLCILVITTVLALVIAIHLLADLTQH